MNKKDQQQKKQTDETTIHKIEELEAKLDHLQQSFDEKEEYLLRTLADLQNVRRRAEEDKGRLSKAGAEKMLKAILPSLDHLELALKNAPSEEDDFVKGVKATFDGMIGALAAENIERIDQTGVPVDPQIHEVIGIDPEAKPDEVSEIYQAGYRLDGKVVRAARVRAGGA